MRIKIRGVISLDMRSKEAIQVTEMRKTMVELAGRLDDQVRRNGEMELIINELRGEVERLGGRLKVVEGRVEESEGQILVLKGVSEDLESKTQ